MKDVGATAVMVGIEGIAARVGDELGVGDWVVIDQDRIDQFAEATGDFQWIHVDPEQAKDGPFGATIAHGLLTLSVAPTLMRGIYRFEGFSLSLNYGYDRVRFTAPAPVGSHLRARVRLAGADPVPGGVQCKLDVTVEREGQEKPVCVFTWLTRQLL